MGQEIPQPNQVSYEFACQQIGKIFIESQYEIQRLSTMLLELQEKFSSQQAQLEASKKEIEQLKIRIVEQGLK